MLWKKVETMYIYMFVYVHWLCRAALILHFTFITPVKEIYLPLIPLKVSLL